MLTLVASTEITDLKLTVDQGESFNLLVTLRTPAGNIINASMVDTLTATLYNKDTSGIINSRNNINVKNANGGTVDGSGILTMRLDPADNVIISGSLAVGQLERHVIKFKFTWNDGTAVRTGIEERVFDVRKIAAPV